MSRSPASTGAASESVKAYQLGWRALGRMISEGRSFSGHERNCCFLNLGNGEFADISATTELDYLDDSRALAIMDWNMDGRLDLWMTSRTAPRIRFLCNQFQNENSFVALRLQGVQCNRDAIGARVELIIKDSPRRHVKQLTAGDAYLSQSSKWMHFGVPVGAQIERVTVTWPGRRQESFPMIQAGRFYQLIEGTGEPRGWALLPAVSTARRSNGLENGAVTPKEFPPTDQAATMRTVIVGKTRVPELRYQDRQGDTTSTLTHQGQPLLVNLWSSTCASCLRERRNWSRQADRMRDANLEVLTLSVDALLDSTSAAIDAQQSLQDVPSQWLGGMATAEVVQTLEMMHHTYVEWKQELPLPCSFLMDRRGHLAAIYKGPVTVDQLLHDVALLDEEPVTRRASAVPFAGRWASQPFRPQTQIIARNLERLGRTSDAIRYVRRCLGGLTADSVAVSSQESQVDLYAVLGELLLASESTEEALVAFDRALELGQSAPAIHRSIGEALLAQEFAQQALPHLVAAVPGQPHDAELHYHIGLAALASGAPRLAIEHLDRSYRLEPIDANVCFQLANALHAVGRTAEALPHYQKALELRPGWPFAANNLAWILATHRDPTIRDGRTAVRVAETLRANGQPENASWLATLAAAYAEVERFEDAASINDAAMNMAIQRGQDGLASKLRQRTALFRAGRPLRE